MESTVKTVKIISVTPYGQGKVANLDYEVDGKTGKAKCWTDPLDKKIGELVEGTLSQEEKYGKPGEFEIWFKVPKPASGGNPYRGGGGNQAGAAERTALEKEKQKDFKEKWATDRESDSRKQAIIVAQVILKEACAIELANAAAGERNCEPNLINAIALDLVGVFANVEKAVRPSCKADNV